MDYTFLINEIEFEGKKFIPIVELCKNAILKEDFNFEIIKTEIINDSTEKSAMLTFKDSLLWADSYLCYFKVYWNYDIVMAYKKESDTSEKPFFAMQYYMCHNMVKNVVELYKWGFIEDFEKYLIYK